MAKNRPVQPLGLVSGSQPSAVDYQSRVAKVKGRFRSANPAGWAVEIQRSSEEAALPVSSPEFSLRKQVLQSLQARLASQGIGIAEQGERFFAFCLPKDDASAEDWKRLLDDPTVLSNDVLTTMFDLEQVTANTPHNHEKSSIFYVRTFAFTVEELCVVLNALIEDGVLNDVVFVLLESMRGRAPTDVVFIRYVGMTTHGSAWTRHQRDLYQGQQTRFATRLLQACLKLYEEIIEAAEVHEFTSASTHFDMDQVYVDLREQSLIALFGLPFLLNTAVGGKSASYATHDDDEADFHGLRTNTLECLDTYGAMCSQETQVQIAKYAEQIQEYASSHAKTTGHERFPVTDDVRNMLSDSAIPITVHHWSLLVTIASDLGWEATKEAKAFYKGDVVSGKYCKDILNQLGSWESGVHLRVEDIVGQKLLANHSLPFVDLYPWSQKDSQDFEGALSLLRRYLQIAKPIVVLAFSFHVASAAVGAFQHANGLKSQDFLDKVGSLILSKYDTDAEDAGDDYCVLVLPSFHPGSINHDHSGAKLVMRILSKTYAVAWLAMGITAQLAAGGKLTKIELCKAVQQQVTERTGPSTSFGKTFAGLKLQWKQYRDSKRQAPKASEAAVVSYVAPHRKLVPKKGAVSKPDNQISYANYRSAYEVTLVRWQKAEEELRAIMKCELAEDSSKRPKQIARLYGMSLALLKTEKTGKGSKASFEACLRRIPTGEMVCFYATTLEDRLKDIRNLISLFLDPKQDLNSTEWESQNELAEATDQALRDWIEAKILQHAKPLVLSTVWPTALMQLMQTKDQDLAARLRRELKDTLVIKYKYGEVLHGADVVVKPSGRMSLRGVGCTLELIWEDSDRKEHQLENFYLPSGVRPLNILAKRQIFFVRDGIDIRDEEGNSLGLSDQRSKCTCSLNTIVSMLANSELQQPFLDLWERETKLKVGDVLFAVKQAESTAVYPASFFSRRSKALEIDSRRQRIMKEVQNIIPIEPGDAAWLMHKFFAKHYPKPGDVVDAGNPNRWPESDTVWPKLETFLDDPLYRHHPQRVGLKALCSNARGEQAQASKVVATIGGVLMALREKVTNKTKRSDKGGQSRFKVLYTIEGGVPPGLLAARKEPRLESWSPAGIDAEEGLVDAESEAEEDSSEEPDPMLTDPSYPGELKRKRDHGDDSGAAVVVAARLPSWDTRVDWGECRMS